MDHFTYSIIRPELIAITSMPTPKPSAWALSNCNDHVFDTCNLVERDGVEELNVRVKDTPVQWITQRSGEIREVLESAVQEARPEHWGKVEACDDI